MNLPILGMLVGMVFSKDHLKGAAIGGLVELGAELVLGVSILAMASGIKRQPANPALTQPLHGLVDI